MVETFGMAGMLVIAFFVMAAIYVIMRLLSRPTGDDGDDEEGNEDTTPHKAALGEMSDEEFVDSYTGPILEDATGKLELAVGSIRSGLCYYNKGVWEEAGSEFHTAAKNIDLASSQFKEVVGMVDDQSFESARVARARMEECRRMRALAIRMEEACDAMVEGKTEEAQKLAMVKNELEQAASAFKAP